MDKKKANLLEALARRGVAKIKISIIDGNMKDHMDEFKDIYVEIIKLSDPTDSKVHIADPCPVNCMLMITLFIYSFFYFYFRSSTSPCGMPMRMLSTVACSKYCKKCTMISVNVIYSKS